MKIGKFAGAAGYYFTAGESLSDRPPRRVASPSSILALTLLAQQNLAAQSFVLSTGEEFVCPSKESELSRAIREIYS